MTTNQHSSGPTPRRRDVLVPRGTDREALRASGGRIQGAVALCTGLALLAGGVVGVLSVGATANAGVVTVQDSFERTVTTGWGVSSGGSAWKTAVGAASFRVDGHHGVTALNKGQFSRATLSYDTIVDSDVTVTTSLNRLPGGSGLFAGVFSRLSVNGEYRGTARVLADGRVSVLIYRLGATESIIGKETIVTGLSAKAATAFRIRLKTSGTAPTTVSLTVWPATGTRPAAQLNVQDSTPGLQKPGTVGLTTGLSAASAISPVAVSFDDFSLQITTPDVPVPLSSPAAPTPPATPTPSPVVTETPAPAPTSVVSDPPTPAAPGCSGTVVSPADDVVGTVASAPPGSTVCFSAGLYRLAAPLVPKAGVTLRGASGAILDGSVPLTSWVSTGSSWYVGGVLPAAYSAGGQCEANDTNPCQKAEQVFSDGTRLTRVMSLAALAPGTFFNDYTGNRVYVGSNPAGHEVAMDSTHYAIRSSSTGVTVTGLTIQRFASPAQEGALFANGGGWTITDNVVRDNHAIGIFVSSANGSTISGNTVAGNGQLGIGQHASANMSVTRNSITGNNTEGFWIADWESGGFKATKSSGSFADNTVTGNLGVGVWFDIDNKGVIVERNVIRDNAADGIRFEISYDGIIRSNAISGNGFGMKRGGGTSIYSGAGVNINTSSNLDIYSNVVKDNINGIGLQARNRGNGIYGLWTLVNNRVHDNTITMTKGTAWGDGSTGLVQNVGDASFFTSKGNTFINNDYSLDSTNSRRFAWNNTYSTVATWKSLGNDATGTVNSG